MKAAIKPTIKRKMHSLFALILFIYSGTAFAEVKQANEIIIETPYVRAIPPGQPVSAAFMVLKNDTDKELALIKASSDIAETVELHEHVEDNGMLKMRQVPKISIAAKATTDLKPGGYHIMLINLKKAIKPGDIIDISLEFDNGSKQVIKAEVKKIMMGMKMKKKKHANPMPNLMRVYMKMPDELGLSDEQIAKLDAGMKERSPVIKELYGSVAKLEAELQEATLKGEPLEKIDQLANSLMQERLAIIEGKTNCRESFKTILDEKQYQKVVEIYKSKMASKSGMMGKMQSKMAMIKHTNPMPNLMQVVKKMGDKLNLTKEQVTQLKQWQDERGPIMQKQYQAVMKLEADINKAALDNESVDKIKQLADSIMQERIKIIRGKAFCRDNMKRILDDEQYKKVVALYKANFLAH